MTVMNRNTFPARLEEGLNAIFGMTYRDLPEEWPALFDTEKSRRAFEEDVLNVGFGAAPVKAEGAAVAYDTAAEGWTSRYTHEEIAVAFPITEVAIEDNLYDRLVPKFGKALARSMKHTKEIKGAAVLNNSVDSDYVGGDGVSLLSTAHPLQGGGTASNKLATPADLAESSLEDLLIMIRKAKNDRHIPIAMRAIRLVLPPDLEYDGIRLIRSSNRPGTGDNDLNAIKYKGVFNSDPAIINRLSDPDAWYVKTDCPDGLKHFRRVALQRKMEGDFETGNLRYKVRERYSFGWTDWRSLYGSEGAA